MSKETLKLIDQDQTQTERKKLSSRQIGGLLMATLTLGSTLLTTGCSAKSTETPKSKQTAEAVEVVEKKAKLSESEQGYAEYLKTLSPEQVRVRESLNPDALAEMNDEELAKAFTIRTEEVVVDGKIDPKLYVEAFTARLQAMYNSGISEKEYAKHGGPDQFGTGQIDAVSKRYNDIESKVLFGYDNGENLVKIPLANGVSTDTLNDEPYHFRITVAPNSISMKQNMDNYAGTTPSEGSVDIHFSVQMTDNVDQKAMLARTGLDIPTTDMKATLDATKIQIIDDAVVLYQAQMY